MREAEGISFEVLMIHSIRGMLQTLFRNTRTPHIGHTLLFSSGHRLYLADDAARVANSQYTIGNISRDDTARTNN